MKSEDDRLRRILAETRTIAIVGVSAKPERPSHQVAAFLQAAGYRIVPVNPGLAGQTLFGERVIARLGEIPESLGPIDMAAIFRRSEEAGSVVDEGIAALAGRGLRTIWMQIGVIDAAAAERAEAVGLEVVMNRCPKIELARLRAA